MPASGSKQAAEQRDFSWRAAFKAAGFGLAGVASLLALAWGYYCVRHLLLEDARFRLGMRETHAGPVPNVVIVGRRYAPESRILEVFALDVGRSIFAIPIEQRRRQLCEIPWVRDATVMRTLPTRLEVRITERSPVAFVLLEGPGGVHRPALIDAEGVILELPSGARFDLPVLVGVSEDEPQSTRMRRVQCMLRFLDEVRGLKCQISEVDLRHPQDVGAVLIVEGKLLRVQLGDRHHRQRLERFLRYLPEVLAHNPSATTFDLRLDDRITVQEVPSA